VVLEEKPFLLEQSRCKCDTVSCVS